MRHLLSPHAAAEPPSDFTSDDSGGGKGGRSTTKKVVLGLGIGCAGLMLIFGVLLAVGAFKVFSFCGNAKDLAMGVAQAQQVSLEFGEKVKGGDWAGAHKLLADDYQKQLSADQLKAMFANKGAALGTPIADGLEVPGAKKVDASGQQSVNLEARDVIAGLRFFPDDPTATKVALATTLNLKILNTEGETPIVKITKITPPTERAIVLAQEPPAQMVKQWHKALNLGERDRAFFISGAEIQQSGRKTFYDFIDKEGDLFTDSKLSVRSVTYMTPTTARVVVQLDSASNRRGVVGFGLQMHGAGRWGIATIAPLATTNDPAPEAPKAPEAPEAPEAPVAP